MKYERYDMDTFKWGPVTVEKMRLRLSGRFRDVDRVVAEINKGFEASSGYAFYRRVRDGSFDENSWKN